MVSPDTGGSGSGCAHIGTARIGAFGNPDRSTSPSSGSPPRSPHG
ncbi:Uncharacterised protein [Mycobacterium tuberculosis]|nr:Uncharacterised protein [Mycobacterium tuberculosis]